MIKLYNAFHFSFRSHLFSCIFEIYRISSINFVPWCNLHHISSRFYRLLSRKNFGNQFPFRIHNSEMIHEEKKNKNINYCFFVVDCVSLNEVYIQRVSIFNKDEGTIDEGFFGFFLLVLCEVKGNLVAKKP